MSSREDLVSLLTDGIAGSGNDAETALVRRPALALAPMATISHAGFRTLVHEFGGCDLYFTEMISAEALISGTPYESYYCNLDPAPTRTVCQLVGYSADAIVEAAVRLARARPGRGAVPAEEQARDHAGPAGIDLNMGCSAPHIVRKGGGIAWMDREDEALSVVERVRAELPDLALSAKLRLGRRDDPARLVGFCRQLEAHGVDFITLHPKRQKEGSARVARWEYVDLLRHENSIPVIGNGGVVSWETYVTRRDRGPNPHRGGLMIGRGAVRAPWIFAYLRERERMPTFELSVDLVAVTERIFSLIEAYQPSDFWPSRARRLYPYLFQNVRFGHTIGAALGDTRDYQEGKARVRSFFADKRERRFHVERR
mgnify:CR=1 FL=1